MKHSEISSIEITYPGGLAQLGEHLPYKQGVGGSSPSSSTIIILISIEITIILSRGGAVVARRAHNPKVAGSNPAPATKWSRGVAVNMPACHAGDRRFDPGRDRHFFKKRIYMWLSSSVGRAKD